MVVHAENLNLEELEGVHGHADRVNRDVAHDAFNWVVQQIYQMVMSCAVQRMLLFFLPNQVSISLEVDLLDIKEYDTIRGHQAHSLVARRHHVAHMDIVVDIFHLHNNHIYLLIHIHRILASKIEELSFALQVIVSVLVSKITAKAIPRLSRLVLQ